MDSHRLVALQKVKELGEVYVRICGFLSTQTSLCQSPYILHLLCV